MKAKVIQGFASDIVAPVPNDEIDFPEYLIRDWERAGYVMVIEEISVPVDVPTSEDVSETNEVEEKEDHSEETKPQRPRRTPSRRTHE